MRTYLNAFSSVALTCLLIACGGQLPRANTSDQMQTPLQPRPNSEPPQEVMSFQFGNGEEEEATPTASPKSAGSELASQATSEAPTNNPLPATEPQPEPPSDGPALTRSPLAILTSPDTAFLINYSNSGPAERARQQCTSSSNDPQAIGECLEKAREEFKADVVVFRKQSGRWSWITYKRAGSRLDEVHTTAVELSEEAPSTVKIKLIGGEKGARPLYRGKREIKVTVPNDYSLLLEEPELGKLLYEAKVGLVAR